MPKVARKAKPVLTEEAVLAAVLLQVPFDGWTDDAYKAGLKQAGATRVQADKLFPDGLRGIIDFFGQAADEAMLIAIGRTRAFSRMKVREKIAFAVRARLDYLTPHREAMRRLMTWYALPHHLPLALKRMSKTVDIIWQAAGDEAKDYNYYTKRILLSAILKAVIIYWLDDDSAGCEKTWTFLDRRIGEVMKLGKGISLLKEFTPSELGDVIRRKLKRG